MFSVAGGHVATWLGINDQLWAPARGGHKSIQYEMA